MDRTAVCTKALVQQAINLVMPSIVGAMNAGTVKRPALHIVVLDPTDTMPINRAPNSLLELSLGKEIWTASYDIIARAKARLSFRCQCSTDEIISRRPFMLTEFDPPYPGGVWLDGQVVACSGVEGHFDEMFAMWIASTIRALCIHEMQKVIIPSDQDNIRDAYLKPCSGK